NADYVLNFVRAYSNNPKRALENYRIKFHLIDKFAELYKDKDKPIMTIITDENKDELLEKSLAIRKNIRGESIGALG
ncbi:MAG: energy-converting hydrogenase A, subunit R, partial [Methanobacteriaceae archaeon]